MKVCFEISQEKAVNQFRRIYREQEHLIHLEQFDPYLMRLFRWFSDVLRTSSEVKPNTTFIFEDSIGLFAWRFLKGLRHSAERVRGFYSSEEDLFFADRINMDYLERSWLYKSVAIEPIDLNFEKSHLKIKNSNGELVEISESADLFIHLDFGFSQDHLEWLDQIPETRHFAILCRHLSKIPHQDEASILKAIPNAKLKYLKTNVLWEKPHFCLIAEKGS